jgi:hypothetical protein
VRNHCIDLIIAVAELAQDLEAVLPDLGGWFEIATGSA